LVTFFDKNRTEPKMITPRKHNKSRSSRLYNSTSNDETKKKKY
jgi:hypothetical protein